MSFPRARAERRASEAAAFPRKSVLYDRSPRFETRRNARAPAAPETTPENPQRPEPSTEPSQDQRRALIDADLKSARTLSTVAAIAGPVSFIIGGVMLSTVGLVCAIVGFVKIKHVIDDVDGRQKVYAATVRQTLIWGLAISAIALIVNIVGIALMMPVLMEAMQTGDFTSILGEGATITAQPSGGSGNAWG